MAMKPTIVATLTVELSLLIIIISSIISLSKCDQTTTETTSIDLHHPDLSPRSPRYDPSLSHYQRVANALQRSSNRHHRSLQASKQTPSAAPTIENIGGNYFLDYSIGINPSVTLKGILSTSSDLIWTPCTNLNRSTSLKAIPCNRCNSLVGSFCDKKRRCSYNMRYGSGSSYKVFLYTDTITLASVKFPNITFGCAINDQGSDGFVGLGGGAVSLVNQIGIGKFSYCLVSIDSAQSTSKLHLGDNAAVVPGVPIPFYIGQDPASYKVKLASITVAGGQKKKVTTLTFGRNMTLDTGTLSTFLPQKFYNTLLATLRTSIGTDNIVKDPNGKFDLCYSSAPGNKFPDITLKFENNVDVKWKQENVFAQVGEKLWCFAAVWIDEDEEAILGNLAQVNYLVGFDLKSKTVTMQPKDCGRSN